MIRGLHGADEGAGLFFEPAYTDNMAMVTPVAPQYLSKMKMTSGIYHGDFLSRTKTTLEFISQILKDESVFLGTEREGCRCFIGDYSRLTNDLGRLRLTGRNLKTLAHRVAASYANRLNELRNKTPPPFPESIFQWEEIQRHPAVRMYFNHEGY
jgi:hypothetical protein